MDGAETETSPNESGGQDVQVEVSLERQAVVASEFLTGLMAELGLEVELSVERPDEETAEITLGGDNLGFLIGPKGATLLALQELARTVVHRKTGATSGRIMVDIGGYRRRRAEALRRFTEQVAADVKRTGTRTALEPMAAPDRKIVHDTVASIEGVTTVSEGVEPRRRVIIIPETQ